MPLVTITGNVWDGGHDPIPAVQQPRLYARPREEFIGTGLVAGTEVFATLQSSGAFTIQLESAGGVVYDFFLDWLQPGMASEPPERRVRGYSQWLSVHPGKGGDIAGLGPWAGQLGLVFGFGEPSPYLSNVVYLDISGPSIRIYGPPGGI